MSSSIRRNNDPETCLTRPEVELVEQTRSWASTRLFVANKLCEGYPNDIRLAKEREKLLAVVQSCNDILYFYAL